MSEESDYRSPDDEIEPPRSRGALRAALLLAMLFALVLGVFGAVYLDHLRKPSPPPPATALATPTSPTVATPTPTPQTTTPAPVPPVSESRATPAPAVVPPATTPPTQQQAIPPASPTPVPTTPAPAPATPSQEAASATSAPTHTTVPAPAPTRPRFERVYWVQFGAYRIKANADHDAATLHKNGIEATVFPVNTPFGIAFYRLRASGFESRKSALAAVDRAQHLLGTKDYWLGRTTRRVSTASP